jgi:hypothetical protein
MIIFENEAFYQSMNITYLVFPNNLYEFDSFIHNNLQCNRSDFKEINSGEDNSSLLIIVLIMIEFIVVVAIIAISINFYLK